MKRLPLIVFLGLFSLALAAQKVITYRDSAKNPHLIVQWNEGYLVPGEDFELSGNVQIKRLDNTGTNGTVETLMTCAKATGKMVKIGSKTEVDDVKMTGGVHLTQTGRISTTEASGNSMTYLMKSGDREVNLNGDVKIDFAGAETVKGVKSNSKMTTTASHANLIFAVKSDGKKEYAEVQTATINGPINFTGYKVGDGGKTQKVAAKADKMTYTHSVDGKPQVTLEGNLDFRELEGDDGAVIEGANIVVLTLNDKNEIVKLKFSSGSSGQVKTTITQAEKQGKKGGV